MIGFNLGNFISPPKRGAPTTFRGVPKKFWYGHSQTRWDHGQPRPEIAGHDRYGVSGVLLFNSHDGPYVRAKHGNLKPRRRGVSK